MLIVLKRFLNQGTFVSPLKVRRQLGKGILGNLDLMYFCGLFPVYAVKKAGINTSWDVGP